MAKNLIRLTESDLHSIILESVRKVIHEMDEMADSVVGQGAVGRLVAKKRIEGDHNKADEYEKYARSKRGLGGGKLTQSYNDGFNDEYIKRLGSKLAKSRQA